MLGHARCSSPPPGNSSLIEYDVPLGTTELRFLFTDRDAKGAFYQHGSLAGLLGNVSEVKHQEAARQTDDLLATVLAGAASQ